MKLVYLHGPPASGKYTIAEGLGREAGLLNFHNHLTLNVARSLFDFGTAEFWEVTHELRRRRIDHPARREMGKLTSVTGLDEFLETWNLVPLDHPRCVIVQTEGREPIDCVKELLERLDLGDPEKGDPPTPDRDLSSPVRPRELERGRPVASSSPWPPGARASCRE